MFYQKPIEKIIRELKTDPATGLSNSEAQKRLKEYGPNLLPQKPATSLFLKFFDQFKNSLVIILLVATAISVIVGETIDALAIATIVILNAFIGFIQEVKAEKTLASLKEKEVQYTLVFREGALEQIEASRVVVGDILILEEGAKIAADGRIIESFSLHVDESILTGESLPASKNPKEISGLIVLADQKNMIFKETEVVAGRGKAIVTATGTTTEIGKIAQALETSEDAKTPLTLELAKVGRTLTIVIGLIAVSVFFLNFLNRVPLVESLLIAISLAVAAIPEGLPAIVTIVLSLGVKRIAEKKTVVKKLPAVETLGAIRIIATDKTGTLTQNKISVVRIFLADNRRFDIEGVGFLPQGVFYNDQKKIVDPLGFPHLETLLTTATLANNAAVDTNGDSKNVKIIGDTTEGALLVAANRAGLDTDKIRKTNPRLYEIPFSSERKMMSVIVNIDDTKDHFLYTKGAPEVILARCNLTSQKKEEVLNLARQLAGKGLRSLSFARKKLKNREVEKALEENILSEEGLEYLGTVGMQDPLRPEIREALEEAKAAGIKTLMITGDHKETAVTIATQAGIFEKGHFLLSEEDVQKLDKLKLAQKIKEGATVFARISPLGKLKIIEAIKSIPHTQVAVTGDGVNDAPALKAAHIGIAMGQTGTDITREVADIVITDDNYATIIDAIREGRTVFANLVKFTRYLISCNLSEVIVVAGGVIMGTPAILLPIQILFINLVTDGLPALALGVDPPEFDVMKRPPRDLSLGILHRKRWIYMIIEGSIMGATTLVLFGLALNYLNYAHAQTMAFATLAFSQLTHAFNNRSTRKSLFRIGFFGNKTLITASVLSISLQVAVTQTAWGNAIFKTTALGWDDWLVVVLFSLVPFLVVEVKKQLRFRVLP